MRFVLGYPWESALGITTQARRTPMGSATLHPPPPPRPPTNTHLEIGMGVRNPLRKAPMWLGPEGSAEGIRPVGRGRWGIGAPVGQLGGLEPHRGKSAMWVSGPPTRNQLWGVLSPLGRSLGHFRLISTARRVFGGPPDLACGVRTPRELLRTVGPTRPRNPLGNLGPFSKAP